MKQNIFGLFYLVIIIILSTSLVLAHNHKQSQNHFKINSTHKIANQKNSQPIQPKNSANSLRVEPKINDIQKELDSLYKQYKQNDNKEDDEDEDDEDDE